eukprot:TRINITY_DN19159_c0_g1_i1.p1 TRINITY_DN19159_c0_g1~~TRINITY_DN19159_c0_g1_i1.p1  ORF type:complete len:335 (-),score=99.72 TRINITY_DN19159_c0_g1_i1:86-1045(-)
MADHLTLKDEATLKAHVAEIRKDPEQINWVLTEMAEPRVLSFVASGTGGIAELVPHLKENVAAYGVVRLTEKVDDNDVVKFVLVDWLPQGVPFMQKAGLGVLRGQVLKVLEPFHNQVTTDNKSELTEQALRDLVNATSGTKSAVRERDYDREDIMLVGGQAIGRDKPKAFAPIKAGQQLHFPEDGQAAINDVRNSATSTNWVVFGYVKGSKDQIELVGSGSGGLPEMASKIMDDGVFYGLYRMVDRIDDSDTVKYATFYWIGDSTPIMHKARVGTHKGEVESFLGQSHVSISTSDIKELAEAYVHDKIMTTSGTKSRVV